MGAICSFCKKDMLKSDGCIKDMIVIDGKEFAQIKVGDPDDFFEGQEDARCGDCNAKYGHYHHPGCDCERCPACGGQLISRGCLD
jgi:hypothetical protein